MRFWVLLGLLMVFFMAAAVVGLEGSEQVNESVNDTSNQTAQVNASKPVECVMDLDCGLSQYSGLNCSGEFIVKEYTKFTCVGAGSFNATCVMNVTKELVSWCDPFYEQCVEGFGSCQPRMTCSDGVQNCHDDGCEEEADCGGPCDPCPSCYNNIRDCHGGKCEEGVDCGGPCPSCEIACSSDVDCGSDRYSLRYCGSEGRVLQDHYTYRCVRPGLYGSWCKPVKVEYIQVDYCGPLDACVNGECVDHNEHGWDKYKTGGVSGPGTVKTLCWGGKCFDIRVYYNESVSDLTLQDY
ncbi:MAG: hypothetical protein NTU61_02505 [Candidatus Altiarchaeota archaeon]|nr:hypothetical protein [Candidatus Altiarchaeota archaeon]